MEIAFKNRIEDLEEYCDFLLKSKKPGKGMRIFIILVIQVGAIFASIVTGLFVWLISLGSWRDGLLFAFLVFFGGQIWLLIKSKFRPINHYGKIFCKKRSEQGSEIDKKIFLLPKRLSITEEWLQVENSVALHRWQWSVIERISLSESFIIIQICKNYVYIIPKREFDSDDDFQYF
jgi:hypothetical protein